MKTPLQLLPCHRFQVHWKGGLSFQATEWQKVPAEGFRWLSLLNWNPRHICPSWRLQASCSCHLLKRKGTSCSENLGGESWRQSSFEQFCPNVWFISLNFYQNKQSSLFRLGFREIKLKSSSHLTCKWAERNRHWQRSSPKVTWLRYQFCMDRSNCSAASEIRNRNFLQYCGQAPKALASSNVVLTLWGPGTNRITENAWSC